MPNDEIIFEGDSQYGHYQIVDTIYAGRPARVLYSGQRQAAQSGIAHDDQDELLFDYNQRFVELVRDLRPQRVLLIGGGAFTLPKALLGEFPRLHLDVVELDQELLSIATRYFDFVPGPETRIYGGDGRMFLEQTTDTYDAILIDAFAHTTVPRSLQTAEAAASCGQRLRPGGVVAMNIIADYYGQRSAVLRRQLAALQTVFSSLSIFPAGQAESLWLPQNFVLVAQNGRRALEPLLRYAPLAVPAIAADDVLHDTG